MSQENVEIVREWLGSVRDSEDFAWHLLAPDAELINATGAPFTNASGHEGFRAWRAEVSDAFEEWSSHPEKVVDAGNAKVLALPRRLWTQGTQRSWHSGKSRDAGAAQAFRSIWSFTRYTRSWTARSLVWRGSSRVTRPSKPPNCGSSRCRRRASRSSG